MKRTTLNFVVDSAGVLNLLLLVHLRLHWSWIKTCGKFILLRSAATPCDREDEPSIE